MNDNLLGFPVEMKEHIDAGEMAFAPLTNEIAKRALQVRHIGAPIESTEWRKAKFMNMGDSGQLVDILRTHFKYEVEREYLFAEIGVHRAETSAAIFRAFPKACGMLVDPWGTYDADHPYRKSGDGCSKLTADQQEANMQAAEEAVAFAGSRASIMRCDSLTAAEIVRALHRFGLTKQRFDWCFIDGDHTKDAVKADIEAWYPLVRDGGVVSGHDWLHPKERRNGQFGVAKAVNEYAETNNLKLNVEGSVWWIQK